MANTAPSPLRRLGLVVNPTAGLGPSHNLLIAGRAIALLAPDEVITGRDELGAQALGGQAIRGQKTPRLTELSITSASDRFRTRELVRLILGAAPDAIVVVGGDGTLADAAAVLVEAAAPTPILGVGVGSTNVGPLVAVQTSTLDDLRDAEFVRRVLDALEVHHADRSLGFAFHDVVVGFTVVGTIGGRSVDVDARARLEGSLIRRRPQSIGRASTRVVRIDPRGQVVVGEGESVGAVVLGLARPLLIGQALAGGACLTALTGLPAGCLVSDRPLVLMGLTGDELLDWPPLKSNYVSLDERSSVRIQGVAAGAAISADGNPLRILDPHDTIEVRVRRNAVSALQVMERAERQAATPISGQLQSSMMHRAEPARSRVR